MKATIKENLNLLIELTPEELGSIKKDMKQMDTGSISQHTKDLLLGLAGCLHAISYEMGRKKGGMIEGIPEAENPIIKVKLPVQNPEETIPQHGDFESHPRQSAIWHRATWPCGKIVYELIPLWVIIVILVFAAIMSQR